MLRRSEILLFYFQAPFTNTDLVSYAFILLERNRMEQLSHHKLSLLSCHYCSGKVDVVLYLLGSWNRLYYRGLG